MEGNTKRRLAGLALEKRRQDEMRRKRGEAKAKGESAPVVLMGIGAVSNKAAGAAGKKH